MNLLHRLLGSCSPMACRHGNAGILFAVLAVPLILSVGAAVDFGRVYVASKTLQSIVDSAAMAGATVFSDETHQQAAINTAQAYFNKGITTLPDYAQVGSPAISVATTSNCDEGAAERITVSATADIGTTLMSIAVPSMAVTVSATAANPQVKFYLDVVKFDFSAEAGDLNGLYWYKVPEDGLLPSLSDMEFIINNVTTTAPKTITACISSAQKIGFAFSVSPAGKYKYYTTNTYGGKYGNTYYYYSTLFPPSRQAYPSWAYDGALQIAEVNADGSYPPPTNSTIPRIIDPPDEENYGYFPANSPPYAAIAASGSVSCSSLKGKAIHLYWNDMGPSDDPEINPTAHDDFNYRDGEITFGCESSQAKPIHLEK